MKCEIRNECSTCLGKASRFDDCSLYCLILRHLIGTSLCKLLRYGTKEDSSLGRIRSEVVHWLREV